MTTSNVIAGRDLGTLRTAIAGDVFARGDHGYDEARRAWNLTTDERPAVVVVAGSAFAGPIYSNPYDAVAATGNCLFSSTCETDCSIS